MISSRAVKNGWRTGAAVVAVALLVVVSPASWAEVTPSPSATPDPSSSPTGEASASPSPSPSAEPTPDISPSLGPSAGPAGELPSPVVDPVIPTEVPSVPTGRVSPAVIDVPGPSSTFAYEQVDHVGYGLTEFELVSVEDYAEVMAGDAPRYRTFAIGGAAPTLEGVYRDVFAESGLQFPGRTSTRVDLLQDELPVSSAGDHVRVNQFPVGDAIPGAAFGMRVDLTAVDAEAVWINLGLDASGLDHLFGGNYGDRLEYVVLPECALTDPDDTECMQGVPVPFERLADGRVSLSVPANASSLLDVDGSLSVPRPAHAGSASLAQDLAAARGLPFSSGSGGTIIAAVSGASGQSGTFAATDLAPVGTWGVSEQSGAFTYSVPISVPPVSTGGAPGVSLNYSSASADGRTPATNGQTSVLGEGWAAPTNYIEQHFVPCEEDGFLDAPKDMCWYSPYVGAPDKAAYTISLNGATYDLVWDGGNRYRTSTEAGWRISQLSGASNGDEGGDYFLVQLPDGSRYYFGLGSVGGESTESVATVPVFGIAAEEPGCGPEGEWTCDQAYRWMLDLSLDPSGNAQTYWYAPESNWYSKRGHTDKRAEYTRAIHLTEIRYGYQWNESSDTFDREPEARVEFVLVGRCVERAMLVDSLSVTVAACPDTIDDNARSYPDVPVDLLCDATDCGSHHDRPVFFTTQRLDQINTYVRQHDVTVTGEFADWIPVDTTQLITTFPDTQDGSARNLWLDSLYTRAWGKAGDASDDLNTYAIKFGATPLNNRVDYVIDDDTRRAVDRLRIAKVITEFGGHIDVTYAAHVPDEDPETDFDAENPSGLSVCAQDGFADDEAWETWVDDNMQDGWAGNDRLCFPLAADEYSAAYHKYVVTELTLSDPVAKVPGDSDDDDVADDAGSSVLETVYHYGYQGSPAWRYAEDPNKEFGDETLAFSDFAGYGEVWSWVGDGDEYAQTRNTYYRGLSEHPLPNGVIASRVLVERGEETGDFVEDVRELAGMLAYTESGHFDATADPAFVATSKSYSDYEVVNALAGVDRSIDLGVADIAEAIPVGDADGDDNADFVVWKNDGSVVFVPGDGEGGIEATEISTLALTFGSSTHWLLGPGDWDSDGKVDLISGDSSRQFWLHEGNGDGTWDAASTQVGSGWTAPWDFVAPGQWGHNSVPDILGIRDDDVWVRYGPSGGGAASSATILGGPVDEDRLLFGDFDGDGHTDAIDHFTDEDDWYVSWGGDSSWDYFNLSTYGPDEGFFAGGDINGDGKDDLLHWSSSKDWRIMYDHTATSWSSLNGSGISDVTFHDIDGDGEDDFLWYNVANERWRVKWSGATVWDTVLNTSVSEGDTLVGEFNEAGGADLAYQSSGGWQIWSHEDSNWSPHNSDTTVGSDYMVGDFDGDGTDDVARRRNGDWEFSAGLDGVWTQLVAEEGSPAEAGGYDYGADFVYQAWDFDGNGISDIVRYGDGGWMALTDGKGDWQPVVRTRWADYANFEPSSDMDGDGHSDLLAISAAGRVTLLLGDGTTSLPVGGRDDVVTQLAPGEKIFAPGDFDGDGVADLIVYDSAGNMTLHAGERRTYGGRGVAEATKVLATNTWSWSAEEGSTVAVETVSSTEYNDQFQVISSESTVSDVVASTGVATSSLTTCTLYEHVWSVENGTDTGFFNVDAWGGDTYLTATTSAMSLEGSCDPEDSGTVITGYSETFYDFDVGSDTLSNFDQEDALSLGRPTLELSYPDYDPAATVAANRSAASAAYAEYDAYGRIAEAYLPMHVAIHSTSGNLSLGSDYTSWAYGAYAVDTNLGVVRDVEVTTHADGEDYVASTWLEPTRGNVVRSESLNGDFTFYRYDAFGMLVEGYAPKVVDPSAATLPWLRTTPPVPDVSYEYDIYAPGVAIRKTPVAVMTAEHSGTDSSGDPFCVIEACYVNRSYTFMDGWGRVREQHAVSPGGSGGRLVSATFYDELGRVEWGVDGYYNSDSAAFESGLANPVKGALDRYTEFEYDWAGRVLTQRVAGNEFFDDTVSPAVPDPLETVTTYLERGTIVESPSGATVTTTNDYLGRLIAQIQAEPTSVDPETITTTYDYFTLMGDGSEAGFTLAGQAGYSGVLVTDAEGNETLFVSNLAGQRTEMLDPNSGLSRYVYDKAGNTLSVSSYAGDADPSTDLAYGVISMSYDGLGRMVARTSEVLNAAGTAHVASSNALWEYESDPAADHTGALIKETARTVYDPDAYDANSANGVYDVVKETTAWDALHRPTAQKVTLPTATELGDLSGEEYVTTVAYDVLGRPFETTLPQIADLPAETVTTGYTIFGQARTLSVDDGTDEYGVVTGVTLDKLGRLYERAYGNELVRRIEWDNKWQAPTRVAALWTKVSEYDSAVQDDKIGRDAWGRITSIEDARGSGEELQCFVYDGFNRLTEAWTVDSSLTCATGASSLTPAQWGLSDGSGYATQWSYSDSGRIESMVHAYEDSSATAFETLAYTYPSQGTSLQPHAATAITGGVNVPDADYTYDDAGRMVERDFDGTSSTVDDQSLVWDAMSNLVELDADGDTWRFIYDASGQRVAKIQTPPISAGLAWAYFGATEVHDPDVVNAGDATGTRFYSHGGASVALRQGSGLFLSLGDVQGSADVMVPLVLDTGEPDGIKAITATEANAAKRNSYTPYGAVRGGADTIQGEGVERGWLNQVADTDLGLTYLNARYYDKALGRFLSPDPLMNPTDPRTLDPYRYADNNPVVYQDASGLMPRPCNGRNFIPELGCVSGGPDAGGGDPNSPGPSGGPDSPGGSASDSNGDSSAGGGAGDGGAYKNYVPGFADANGDPITFEDLHEMLPIPGLPGERLARFENTNEVLQYRLLYYEMTRVASSAVDLGANEHALGAQMHVVLEWYVTHELENSTLAGELSIAHVASASDNLALVGPDLLQLLGEEVAGSFTGGSTSEVWGEVGSALFDETTSSMIDAWAEAVKTGNDDTGVQAVWFGDECIAGKECEVSQIGVG